VPNTSVADALSTGQLTTWHHCKPGTRAHVWQAHTSTHLIVVVLWLLGRAGLCFTLSCTMSPMQHTSTDYRKQGQRYTSEDCLLGQWESGSFMHGVTRPMGVLA
jgi:hypothetical protein